MTVDLVAILASAQCAKSFAQSLPHGALSRPTWTFAVDDIIELVERLQAAEREREAHREEAGTCELAKVRDRLRIVLMGAGEGFGADIERLFHDVTMRVAQLEQARDCRAADPGACPDCDAPLASEADRRDDDAPHPEDDLLCWRAYHYDVCQRPVDWRARCRLAEAERDCAVTALAASESVRRGLATMCDRLTTAHADAQAMLDGVAAERDAAQTRWQRACDELNSVIRQAGQMIGAARQEASARDAALDACATRISDLLAEVATLTERRDALLALVANISQTTPLAEELQGWEGQRAALIAELGTIRARLAEAERINQGGE